MSDAPEISLEALSPSGREIVAGLLQRKADDPRVVTDRRTSMAMLKIGMTKQTELEAAGELQVIVDGGVNTYCRQLDLRPADQAGDRHPSRRRCRNKAEQTSSMAGQPQGGKNRAPPHQGRTSSPAQGQHCGSRGQGPLASDPSFTRRKRLRLRVQGRKPAAKGMRTSWQILHRPRRGKPRRTRSSSKSRCSE